MLSSSARAVTGECPKCGSTVYKILPGKSAEAAAKSPVSPKSNIVSINHRSWFQQAAASQLPKSKAASQQFHQPSFIFGVAAGVFIMLAVIVTHVYLV
jgi:hypothetical protein